MIIIYQLNLLFHATYENLKYSHHLTFNLEGGPPDPPPQYMGVGLDDPTAAPHPSKHTSFTSAHPKIFRTLPQSGEFNLFLGTTMPLITYPTPDEMSRVTYSQHNQAPLPSHSCKNVQCNIFLAPTWPSPIPLV